MMRSTGRLEPTTSMCLTLKSPEKAAARAVRQRQSPQSERTARRNSTGRFAGPRAGPLPGILTPPRPAPCRGHRAASGPRTAPLG
jgi:hypothetical protein